MLLRVDRRASRVYLKVPSGRQCQLRQLVRALDSRVVQHADHLVRRRQVHGSERKARTLAMQHVVALYAVFDGRTDGRAEMRAIGVIEPASADSKYRGW